MDREDNPRTVSTPPKGQCMNLKSRPMAAIAMAVNSNLESVFIMLNNQGLARDARN